VLDALRMVVMAVPAVAVAADPFAGVHTVEVFANSTMVITQPAQAPFAITVYRVDGIAQAEALASQGLPQTEVEMQRYLAANQAELRRRIEPLVRNALQGLQLAQKYQLDRMPAVVVNQQSVVIGLTDVSEALHRYQAHRQARSGE
jgi:integrating conjugative element protein (TIGR03757 family)